MRQAFVDGRRVSITRVLAGPSIVTHIKTQEKDGYTALQLGFGTRKLKNLTNPLKGHLKGATQQDTKVAPRFLREVEITDTTEFPVGTTFTPDQLFAVGDTIMISGISKGKGFAGAVKRHHFAGGPKTHGQSDRLRAPGSIGQGTTPGRVLKGKRMAGRMGSDRITIKNLRVVSVDPQTHVMELSGPVPGTEGTLLMITKLKGSTNA